MPAQRFSDDISHPFYLVDATTGQPVGSSGAPVYFASSPGTVINGQIKISVTGTAVQLPAAALVNGLVITASPNNGGRGFIGAAGVNTTDDGTGTGYGVSPGGGWSGTPSDASQIWINGTAGYVFYYTGS